MILIFSILFYFLVQRWSRFLWLILPLSIFLDLWRMDSLGATGLKILGMLFIIGIVFGPKAENYRLKI